MKKLFSTLLILFIFAFYCKADSLLINIKSPTKERILLYENRYYIKLKLLNSDEKSGNQMLTITEGTYKILNNEIHFMDEPPWEDTVITRYWTWMPKVAGPKYTYDFDQLVEDVFGSKIKIDSVSGTEYIVATAKINGDGILVLNRKSKYIFQNYKCH